MKQKEKREGWIAIVPLFYIGISFLIVWAVCQNGLYPTGSDTMYHIYRGNYIYQSFLEGDYFPLLNIAWYNGVELMRYWAPVSAYVLAFCQFLASGDPFDGYLIFVGLLFFCGAMSWLHIGKKLGRPWFGAFLGVLWFFMPNNLLALFTEGNLARSVIMIFLPLFIHACHQYLFQKDKKALPKIAVYFACMTLCHVGYAGMIALTMLLFFLFYKMFDKQTKKRLVLNTLLAIVIGFLLTGIYLVPSLVGGITSMDTSENMASFFQSILITLNPFDRIVNGYVHFYFGLAACLIAILGVLFGRKQGKIGFLTSLVVLLCTTTALYYVLRVLPGSQYLWMLRFISIALCMILYSFLLWDNLKKGWVLVFSLLLIADIVPSLGQLYGNHSGQLVEERLDEIQEATLISEAQEITTQRLALMDVSRMGSMGAWLTTSWNHPVNSTFGAGWEAANTASNISQLNRAVENGHYLYLFDRALELGNDSVLVLTACLDEYKGSVEELDAAANKVGYELVAQKDGYRLYHRETPECWGTKTVYEGIAIGTGAGEIALCFPALQESDKTYLDDYTFEELKNYQLICLDGFSYHRKEDAEELILQLSDAGVRIVIMADGIPEDKKTHAKTFLGVTCNYVEFSNGYPEFVTTDGIINADLFPDSYAKWETVYTEGLDEVWGYTAENDIELPFCGTAKRDNIVFVGIDLIKFYGLTLDRTVGAYLEKVLQIASELPQRAVVPLEITSTKDRITITSEGDGVNTSLAYHGIFKSEQSLTEENHLLVVEKGTTYISLERPYFWSGLAVSLLGILLLLGIISKN